MSCRLRKKETICDVLNISCYPGLSELILQHATSAQMGREIFRRWELIREETA